MSPTNMYQHREQGEYRTPIIDITPRNKWEIPFLAGLQLYSRGLYKPNLAYRCFSPLKIHDAVERGTDRDATSNMWELTGISHDPSEVIWVNGESILLTTNPPSWDSSFPTYQDGIWAVSVYDTNELTYIPGSMNGFLKGGSRPLAILRVHMDEVQNLNRKDAKNSSDLENRTIRQYEEFRLSRGAATGYPCDFEFNESKDKRAA